MNFLVLNGPNLNLLGEREPELYGSKNLAEIQQWTEEKLKIQNININLTWIQTNSESELLNHLHDARNNHNFRGIIINPAGLSHTSVVLLDALLAMAPIPIVEVHLTNPCSREEFRQQLLTAKAATIIMSGLGFMVYYFAVLALYETRFKK